MIQASLVVESSGRVPIYEKTGLHNLDDWVYGLTDVLVNVTKINGLDIGHANLGSFRAVYTNDGEHLFVMISDVSDNHTILEETLRSIWSAIKPLVGAGRLEDARNKIVQMTMGQTIKISLFGQPMVGKTTLVSYILGKMIPIKYKPTIGVETSLVPNGLFGRNSGVVLWDVAGQPKFSTLWPRYLKSSQLVLAVTDSQLRSVLWLRKMLTEISEWASNAVLLGIANKQDLVYPLTEGRVEDILGVPTIGVEAINPFGEKQRQNLMQRMTESLGIRWVIGDDS